MYNMFVKWNQIPRFNGISFSPSLTPVAPAISGNLGALFPSIFLIYRAAFLSWKLVGALELEASLSLYGSFWRTKTFNTDNSLSFYRFNMNNTNMCRLYLYVCYEIELNKFWGTFGMNMTWCSMEISAIMDMSLPFLHKYTGCLYLYWSSTRCREDTLLQKSYNCTAIESKEILTLGNVTQCWGLTQHIRPQLTQCL